MHKVNISYLKNNLSAILAKLNSYASVVIMDREAPVAVLYPYTSKNSADIGHLADLERKGILRRSHKQLDLKLLKSKPPRLLQEVDVSQMLINDRKSTT